MIRAKEEYLTLSQIVKAIQRRFVSVVFITGMLTFAGLIAILMLRDTYQSEGEFYLNAGRGTVTIDPTATTSQTSNLMDTRQSEIQSIKDMLGSRMMLERTVRRVGLDRLLEQRSWSSIKMGQFTKFLDEYLGVNDTLEDGLTAEQTADLQRTQSAVEYVADRISFFGDKEGNTVQIKAKAHTSLLAHDVVQALMSEFQEQYVKVHRTVGSQNFFDNEYSSTQERLREAEARLAECKNEMKAISIESKRELLHKESEVVQEDLIKTQAQIVAHQAEIGRLETLIAAEPVMIATQATSRSNTASDSMRGDLYRLEVAESDLASKYNDDHPTLINARQALKDAREAYQKQDALFDEKAQAINPIRQELMITKLKAMGSLEALQAREKALVVNVASNEKRIEQLNNDEIRVAELTRSVDHIRDELKNYSHKREEARRQAELDQSLISALQVSQEATHVIKKVGPPRMLGLAVIGTFSLLFACAIAVYRESTNRLDDDLSPINGYSERILQSDLRAKLAAQSHEGDYEILSGRLTEPSFVDSKRNGASKAKPRVHVTENVRG
jgi:uncharacterized protein involved in exopolysaccharide biosynthesis